MLESKKDITSESKFYKVAYMVVGDLRWKAIDERERESLFQDYLDDLANKEKAEYREKKSNNYN